jgi:DNA-binding NarL/FixJ family response regulator
VIRVLIADDEGLVRAGFRAILEAEEAIEVVGEAADGREAVAMALALRPTVALMDIRMPGLDGLQAARRLLRECDPTKVLVVTTFDLDEYVYEAMKAGASGFLLKDAPREQLTAAVRLVARGEELLAPAITRRLIERFLRDETPGGAAAPSLESLSAREIDVFRHLARGLSNAEIAAELVVSRATVKTHVASILNKLGLRDRVQAVVAAYESGLVRAGAADAAGREPRV